MTIGGNFLPKSAQKAGFGYGKTGNALKKWDLPPKILILRLKTLVLLQKFWIE